MPTMRHARLSAYFAVAAAITFAAERVAAVVDCC